MAEERLTEELLERLRASARPEAYLDEGVTIDRKLSDYLYELRIEKGLKRSTIIKACGINQTQGYDVLLYPCEPEKLDVLEASLITALDADASYNAPRTKVAVTLGCTN